MMNISTFKSDNINTFESDNTSIMANGQKRAKY